MVMWVRTNVRKGLAAEEKTMTSSICVFSRRGALRRCAGTRGWEKRWQHEKPQQVLRPTFNPPRHPIPPPPPPTLRNTPLPTLSHMSPPSPPLCHTPPYYYETTTAWEATPRQWEVQMGLGVERKSKNNLGKRRKINVSHPLFPKKNVFAPFQMRIKKTRIDKWQWVLVL